MTPTVSWIVCLTQICDLCFILFYFYLNYHALSCCLNSHPVTREQGGLGAD